MEATRFGRNIKFQAKAQTHVHTNIILFTLYFSELMLVCNDTSIHHSHFSPEREIWAMHNL